MRQARRRRVRRQSRISTPWVRACNSCLLLIFVATLTVQRVKAKYPQDALRCLASLREPDELLICPEHRNGYCVKEVSTLEKEDCGRSTFFGDKWNHQTEKCEYRKCEASCSETSWDFEFEGEAYERYRYCCDFNYCNGSRGREGGPHRFWLWTSVVAVVLLHMYTAGVA